MLEVHLCADYSRSLRCADCGHVYEGLVPGEQLDALSAELARADVRNRFLYLSLHYPIMNRHGTM